MWRFKRGERISRKTTRTWEEEWKAKQPVGLQNLKPDREITKH
jgi:hypothetical protein